MSQWLRPKRLAALAAVAVTALLIPRFALGADPPATPIRQHAPTLPPTGKAFRPYNELEDIAIKKRAPYFFAPWAAALTRNRSAAPGASVTEDFFCNATLIDPRWALTAAHCVTDLSPRDLTLRYGHEYLEDTQSVAIANIFTHPRYVKATLSSDIALLEFREPVQSLMFAPLPQFRYDPSIHGTAARVFGWGIISEELQQATGLGQINPYLVQIDATVIADSLCNSPTYYAGRIEEHMLCAGSTTRGIDACFGFGGSALVGPASSGEVIGLVNWGQGCGHENRPTVYIEVGYFVEWIESRLGADE